VVPASEKENNKKRKEKAKKLQYKEHYVE